MQTTTEKSRLLRLKPCERGLRVSTWKPCLNRMTADSARMHATDRPSSTSVSIADRRTSLKAMKKPIAPLIRKNSSGVTVPWTPESVQELLAHQREAAQPGGADEEVTPHERPAGHHPGGAPRPRAT